MRKPATYDDLVALPENMVGQIIDGELIAFPRPASDHAFACSVLMSELGGPFQKGSGGPGGWWILFEPELHFGPDVLVPDLAGWTRERLPEVTRRPWFELAPDWVCEFLSPSTARFDRTKKLPVYARQGVAHVWLVDPLHRTFEAYRRVGAHWLLVTTAGDADRVRAAPFEALELALPSLWGETGAPAAAP